VVSVERDRLARTDWARVSPIQKTKRFT